MYIPQGPPYMLYSYFCPAFLGEGGLYVTGVVNGAVADQIFLIQKVS